MLSNQNILNYLGLVSKAKKLTTGDMILKSIRSNESKLVIIAADASENAKKKISDKCQFYQVDYIIWGTVDEISHAIGKNNRVAISINDKGFAKKLKDKLGG